MKRTGFTLVELIVALTIFTMLLGGMLYVFSVELSIWKKIVAASEKQQIANMVMTRIIRDVRNAEQILPTSSNEKLLLKIKSETIEYSINNNMVRRKKDNYSTHLTAAGDIQQLLFSYPAPKQVEIRTDDFISKIGLRN